MMENLLRGGDYVPDGFGGFVRLRGEEKELQRALYRLTCRRGALCFLPRLGSRLYRLGREKTAARDQAAMQMAAEAARTGVEVQNREALAAIIKSKTEAYILDKAHELGLDVSADVTVEMESAYPYPAFVQITGAFTPQQQETLTRYIEENLAIGKERQIWTNE